MVWALDSDGAGLESGVYWLPVNSGWCCLHQLIVSFSANEHSGACFPRAPEVQTTHRALLAYCKRVMQMAVAALGCRTAVNHSSESCLRRGVWPCILQDRKEKNTLLLSGETGYLPGKWRPASIDLLQLLRPREKLSLVLQEIWLTVHSQQALFVRAKGSHNPRCPNTAEWIKSSGQSFPVKYFNRPQIEELHQWNKGWVKPSPYRIFLYEILKKQAKAKSQMINVYTGMG